MKLKVLLFFYKYSTKILLVPLKIRNSYGIIQKEINFYQEMASEHRLQENVSTLAPLLYFDSKLKNISHFWGHQYYFCRLYVLLYI